jgi:GR25 family glycosyltransferase involved in LPS biosynthesis
MLKTFIASGKPVLLALEDDVIFRGDEGLQGALSELPADWDMLFLGANITEGVTGILERPPVRVSDRLFRVRAAWTTHAVAYTREAAKRVACAYDGVSMYDAWLSETMLPKLNAYLVNPMVAYQRPGISDLWGTETDYTGAFEKGNQIMKS